MNTKILTVLCVLLLVPFSIIFTDPNSLHNRTDMMRVNNEFLAYTEHAPVVISSNGDFLSQGWPGNGTLDDPYMIQGLNITTSGWCISIQNTGVHFKIRDCLLTWTGADSGVGIFLQDVQNASIIECKISKKSSGVYSYQAGNLTFFDNLFEGNNVGVEYRYSEDIVFENNNVSRNRGGIKLYNSNNITIIENHIESETSHGVQLDSSSYNHIVNNTFVKNNDNAIELLSSTYNSIEDNEILDSYVRGIYLSSASSNLIVNNTINQGNDIGIDIDGSTNETILENDFVGCGIWIIGDNLNLWKHNITGNLVNSRPLGYFWNANNLNLNGNDYGQFIIVNSSNIVAENGNFDGATAPIQLVYSSFCQFENITSINGVKGAYLHSSYNISLVNCSFSFNSEAGVYMYSYSDNNTIVNTTIRGNDEFGIYMSTSDNNTFVNDTIENSDCGVRVSVSYDNIFANNTIKQNNDGVYVSFSIRNLFVNNYITQNQDHGISTIFSDHNVFFNNSISDNQEIGVSIYTGAYNEYINNSIQNNELSGLKINICRFNIINSNRFVNCGVFLDSDETIEWNQTLINNTVNDRPLGYFLNKSDEVINMNDYGQVILAQCRNVTVEDGVQFGASQGIQIGHSIGCRIEGVTCLDNRIGVRIAHSENISLRECVLVQNYDYGVHLQNSTQCIVQSNDINGNFRGIFIEQADYNTLDDNTVDDNVDSGIYVKWSSGSKMTNNRFSGNNYGIYLFDSDDDVMSFNSISEGDTGIYLSSSFNDTMNNNTIFQNNDIGIDAHYSSNNTIVNNTLYLNLELGIKVVSSSYNVLWGNLLTENGNNAQDDGSNNYWDNSIDTGNAWGDYSGSGVYSIPGTANAVDYYPSIAPDLFPPSINQPEDIEYNEETEGHSIHWTPSTINPSSFEIYRNGTQIDSREWNGYDVILSIDGLLLGVYNFTLVVYNIAGSSTCDTVIVTVFDENAPLIDDLEDITYITGTAGHSISWYANDRHPHSYVIYRNGSLLEEGEWNTTYIVVDIDGLEVGYHNYTLLLYDTSGNTANRTVFVLVIDSLVSTTTTTITTTTGPSGPDEGLFDLTSILISVSILVLLVLIIYYVRRRR